jgi:hypothetical protein
MTLFDASAAQKRLDRLWSLKGEFGLERSSNRIFLDEIVSDRLQLLSGLQVVRDELQFTEAPPAVDREACPADFSQPSVVTTLAVTNCGDRIHQEELAYYQQVVATRFATISELGSLKLEAFHPTGGGTDDGATLAHVTWAHALDEPLRERIYRGNAQSYVLCGFDLKTHVGRLDTQEGPQWGQTKESRWREARAACGAIVGALKSYDPDNSVHRRLRSDLGDDNFDFLTREGVRTRDGADVTAVVAAAIIAVRGMHDTARALTREMDARGVAHLTASITVNRPSMDDTMLYLARATVAHGKVESQGLGTDAGLYKAELMTHKSGDRRLRFAYDGHEEKSFPIVK